MKVAFTGKGGAGKTTIAAILIHYLAGKGRKVLAVDCDPDSNLAGALGFEGASKIVPICRMKDLIRDRMGIKDKDPFLYKLNPKIDDIPAEYTRTMGGISILVMGTVEKAGGGCVCPESIFLRNLLNRIMLKEDEDIVLDMEAGVEHLGRRTAEICGHFIVVVEPSAKSAQTAIKIDALARGLGAKDVYAVANKVRSKEDSDFIAKELGRIRVVASVPFSDEILSLDKHGSVGQLMSAAIKDAADGLLAALKII